MQGQCDLAERVSFGTQNLPGSGEILQTEGSAISATLRLNVTAVARTLFDVALGEILRFTNRAKAVGEEHGTH